MNESLLSKGFIENESRLIVLFCRLKSRLCHNHLLSASVYSPVNCPSLKLELAATNFCKFKTNDELMSRLLIEPVFRTRFALLAPKLSTRKSFAVKCDRFACHSVGLPGSLSSLIFFRPADIFP